MTVLPLIAPHPPRLSELGDDLRRVEASGIYSNNGPEARAFEREVTERLFGGRGATLAVSNATSGLMLALANATEGRRGAMALMPAMTFAATAQAAWWAGLTPLVCDIDADDWSACAREEERLLHRHGEAIAAIIPYATFGRAIDVERYRWIAQRYGVAIVVDAAASLGSRDADGVNFGAGAPFPVVFSMHATKPFATAEGGLIHCGDVATIERLRAAANFGFGKPRTATVPGLNAKLPEVLAVLARARLTDFDAVCVARDAVVAAYRDAIEDRYATQPVGPGTQAHGFFPLLLPDGADRDAVIAALAGEGVGAGAYFSPHLGQHPWVRDVAIVGATPVADDVAARLLSLPVHDTMRATDAARAVAALDRALSTPRVTARAASPVHETLLIGGGPAGTAMLTAASRTGRLPELARGLAAVEASASLGAGRLGGYAITSDSSAETFLTAIADNPHAEIAALADHPAAARVMRWRGKLGVPLTEVGPLLDVLGDRLAGLVRANGGQVLTGMRALGTRRGAGGLWHTRVEDVATGRVTEHRARNIVIATGGHQPLDRVAQIRVAGASLAALAYGRLVQSDAVLSVGGADMVADLLREKRAPRIAVVGGSASALTAIAALLKAGLPLGPHAITLLHRRPLRPFYPSAEAAQAEGFTDFGADDICPVSGFVYRLAGFRLEARDLVVRMLGIDGRVADPRVALHRIAAGVDETAQAIVRQADVVVGALGYRPHALPIEGVALAADRGDAMVDRHCRVLDAGGRPVEGLYGIGLAAGFVPWGKLGGEASFRGQANGLWLWQNDVGAMIVDQLLGSQVTGGAIGVAA